MKWKYYNKKINYNTIGRCDISLLFQNPKVFSNLINDLIKPFKKVKFDKIIGIDALGFVLSSAVALKMMKPLILIRKGNKLPLKNINLIKQEFTDYSGNKKLFEISKFSIRRGEKIIIVDDWIETGNQIKAAIKLIEKLGGIVVGISTINLDKNTSTQIF